MRRGALSGDRSTGAPRRNFLGRAGALHVGRLGAHRAERLAVDYLEFPLRHHAVSKLELQ